MSKIILFSLLFFGNLGVFQAISFAEDGRIIDMKLSTKGNDIAFDQTALQVPLGKKINLRFINQADKDSEILHNVAILKPGRFDTVMKVLQKSGYDIEKIRKHPDVLAMTKALKPGTEEILEFSPTKAGFYPYVCLMPGHSDMLGMKGILNVTASK
jgi:uncharacterized cupredoxin-like copper-binding protein